MRVYERSSERWEIELREQLVITRRYEAGVLVDETPAEHSSFLRAKWEADKICTRLAGNGYKRILDDDLGLGKAEFEDALRANPDDRETYLVYADWLSDRGDDWGQLIAIQHALEALPRFGESAKRDELARVETMLRFRLGTRLWGALGETVIDESTQRYAVDLIDAEWQSGFVRRATVRNVDDGWFEILIAGLNELPAALVLRELALGFAEEDWPMGAMEAVAARKWPTLRELVIYGGHETSQVLPILANAPRLARLEMHEAVVTRADVAELAASQRAFEYLALGGTMPADTYAKLRHLAPTVRVVPNA